MNNIRHYTDFLKEELVIRQSSNALYSERAFAASIGLSPSFFKLLLQKKRNLSVQRAADVAHSIGWDETKIETFVGVVKSQTPCDYRDKRGKHKKIELNTFSEIADLHCFAIIELLKTAKSPLSIEDISQRLSISIEQSNQMVHRLFELGFISKGKKGRYKSIEKYEVPSMSSEVIQRYHKQVLEKASQAAQQPTDVREYRSLTLAFDSERMTEAKKAIEKFMVDFDRKFGTGDRDSVYQFTMAFFRLDTKESP